MHKLSMHFLYACLMMVLSARATTLLTGGVVTTVIGSNIIGTEYTMVTVTYTYPPTPATTTTILTDAAAAAASLASKASAAPSGATFASWDRCASGEECYGELEAVSSPFIPRPIRSRLDVRGSADWVSFRVAV